MAEMIFCPRCGKQSDVATSYCRTCGFALDEVNSLVNADLANSPEATTRPNLNLIRVGAALFIIGTVLGLANIVARDFDLFPEIYGKTVFLAFVIAGLLSFGLSFLFPITVYKKRRAVEEPSRSSSLDTGPLHPRLPPAGINDAEISIPKDARTTPEPASITEHTTRNLS